MIRDLVLQSQASIVMTGSMWVMSLGNHKNHFFYEENKLEKICMNKELFYVLARRFFSFINEGLEL